MFNMLSIKKISLLIILLVVSVIGYSQQLPNKVLIGSTTILGGQKGITIGNGGTIIADTIYVDTTAANLRPIAYYNQAVIITGTTGNYTMWFRTLAPPVWTKLATGSIPSTFNPSAGYGILLTGSYPNITFKVDTTSGYLATWALVKKKIDSLGTIKVNYTDTSAMLTAYLRKIDTATMLAPYVSIAGYGLTKGTHSLTGDTTLIVPYTDTLKINGIATKSDVRSVVSGVSSVTSLNNSHLLATPNTGAVTIDLATNPIVGNLSATGLISTGQITSIGINGTITTVSQPNITLVGTLSNLSVSGRIDAGLFSGSGANLSNIPPSALTSNSITIGSTNIPLGTTTSSIAGLSNITVSTVTSGGTSSFNSMGANDITVKYLTVDGVGGYLNVTNDLFSSRITNSGNITNTGTISTESITAIGTIEAGTISSTSIVTNLINTNRLTTTGSVQFNNLQTKSDTALYKPPGIDGSGNLVKMSYWPGSGGVSLFSLSSNVISPVIISNSITTTGNIAAANITATGNITGSGLTITGNASITGSVNTGAISASGSIQTTGSNNYYSAAVGSISSTQWRTRFTGTNAFFFGTGTTISSWSFGMLPSASDFVIRHTALTRVLFKIDSTTRSTYIGSLTPAVITEGGNLSATSIASAGDLSAVGNISGATLSATGGISGASLTISGIITAAAITTSGGVVIGTNLTVVGSATVNNSYITNNEAVGGNVVAAGFVQSKATGFGNSYLFKGTNTAGTVDEAVLVQSSVGGGVLALTTAANTQTVLISSDGNSIINSGFPLTIGDFNPSTSGALLQVVGAIDASSLTITGNERILGNSTVTGNITTAGISSIRADFTGTTTIKSTASIGGAVLSITNSGSNGQSLVVQNSSSILTSVIRNYGLGAVLQLQNNSSAGTPSQVLNLSQLSTSNNSIFTISQNNVTTTAISAGGNVSIAGTIISEAQSGTGTKVATFDASGNLLRAAIDLPSSGSYTPTLTNTTNITSSSLSYATYFQIGNIVHVNIGFSLLPTLSTTNSVLTVSLPVNTATVTQLYVGNGTVFGNGVSNLFSSGLVDINGAGTATFTFQSMALTSSNGNISFDYKIN